MAKKAKKTWRKRRPGEGACKVCGDLFTEDDCTSFGRRCRSCYNAWHRKNAATNPRTKRARLKAQIKFRYGIGIEVWDELFEAQGGRCAVCERIPDGTSGPRDRRLHVDHCHTTEEVRGLLCLNCNLLVGHAKEDVEILKKAAAYVSRGNKRKKRKN